MREELISAEVEPLPRRAARAARELERLGFRVLHIGPTISVQGSLGLWKSTFKISFKRRRKRLSDLTDEERSFALPDRDPVPVPSDLQNLIASVSFAEPPEFYGGPS